MGERQPPNRRGTRADDDPALRDRLGTGANGAWLSFVVVFLVATAVFLTAGQGYLAFQHRGGIDATVTAVAVPNASEDPSVRLAITVANPTAVPITVDGPAGVSARVGDRIVARAHASDFTPVRVQARGKTRVTLRLRLHPDASVEAVRRAIATDRLALSGRFHGTLRDRSLFVPLRWSR